jgi:hypothetical protein
MCVQCPSKSKHSAGFDRVQLRAAIDPQVGVTVSTVPRKKRELLNKKKQVVGVSQKAADKKEQVSASQLSLHA